MTHFLAMSLAIFCVILTAVAQVMLRAAMSSAPMQDALSRSSADFYWLAASSPMVWGGLACFGASVALWLLVLARLEVSVAYPLTSLGLVLTSCAGVWLLGESISLPKVLGILLIVAGVLVLSLKH